MKAYSGTGGGAALYGTSAPGGSEWHVSLLPRLRYHRAMRWEAG